MAILAITRLAHGAANWSASDFQAALRLGPVLTLRGPYQGHGPHRKYGAKLDYRHLPDAVSKRTTIEGARSRPASTRPQALHKGFSQALNVVIMVKTNLQTQAWAHVVLFSSDLTLAYDQLMDYYRLRFQIEFNFRDAKQFWGLEDFMNVTPTAVTNAANLSLFMVDLSQRFAGPAACRRSGRQHPGPQSVLSRCQIRGRGY